MVASRRQGKGNGKWGQVNKIVGLERERKGQDDTKSQKADSEAQNSALKCKKLEFKS